MKITDLALVFTAILLPIITIVYVNVSFSIKAVEQEMYYEKLINSALEDASTRMKEVENDDKEIDYGYSGKFNNKVSINPQIAVNTFFSNLYKNFGIEGNKDSERYLQLFIPVLAVVDYNGVYISAFEDFKDKDGNVYYDHRVHPKRYFSFTYGLDLTKTSNIVDDKPECIILDLDEIERNKNNNNFSVHHIEFSLDDNITHSGYMNTSIVTDNGYSQSANKYEYLPQSFYIQDRKNNSVLFGYLPNDQNITQGNTIMGLDANGKTIVEDYLLKKRREVIIDVLTRELSYYINQHNEYATMSGIKYNFVFPYTTLDEMYDYVEDIGVLGFIQGVSVGNKFLNYKAYAGSALNLTVKYYFSLPTNDSKVKRNLYHNNPKCPEYRVSEYDTLTPRFVLSKQIAASARITRILKDEDNKSTVVQGFYPCPICKP